MEESPYALKEKGVSNSAFVMDNGDPSKEDKTPSNDVSESPSNSSGIQFKVPNKSFFINPKGLLMSLCFASLIQGIIVNGFVNVVISTLEKRFQLSSRETGLIVSSYDLGSTLCVIPLSYLGGRLGSSKPRYISFGLFLMGIGSLMFSLPHFLAGRYLNGYFDDISNNSTSMSLSDNQICSLNPIQNTTDCGNREELSNYKYFFIFGQALHGIGASPLVTLGNTLIDESVGPKVAPLYIGIFSTFFVIGPAIGFVTGGQLLNIYTNFYELSASEIAQIPEALWIGSWWLGFAIMSLLFMICALLVVQFPSVIPGAEPQSSEDSNEFSTIKDLPKALKALVVNPTYMLLSIGGAVDGFWLSSITAFLPKYIEAQYFVSSADAGTLVGIVAVPCGGLGTFMGGWITKRLRLNRSGIIKLYILCQLIAFPLGFSFLLSCKNPDFAGVTKPYYNSLREEDDSILSINAECNQNCYCDSSKYNPICGSDGNFYFSPCHAGCLQQSNNTFFEKCRCIPNEMTASKRVGACSSNEDCNYLVPFMGISGFNIFLTFMASMTTIFATLRAVEPVHKSLALGLSSIILRLLGSIPGPMILGAIIDKGCVLWKTSVCHEGNKNCLIYENARMSMSIMIFFFVFKVLGTLSYTVALYFSKRCPIDESKADENEKV